ncbi:MAG: hypothetical protein K0Q70_64 [Rhodospirillales bacterium]|jgi:hypothetical protein|nr:hypothetical protein [Rhodospirillales bacterium]
MPVSSVLIDVSPGELVDKLTILEIKLQRLPDGPARANVRHEYDVLELARSNALAPSAELLRLSDDLKAVNERLWVIEDDIRDCERAKDFGAKFVELARAVYRENDKRAALKREINVLLGSAIVEEKSYAKY